MKKKLQIFISSTYTDLLEERQAAVQAILKAGHIPAGMELFTAGDISQMETIKRWIDTSDIYMLILGGRYGSIEPSTSISYTEIEYSYAESKNIPLFAVVITENAIEKKVKKQGSAIIETDNSDKLKAFRKKILSKTSSFFHDSSDIKLAIYESVNDFQDRYDFKGWVSGEYAKTEEDLEKTTTMHEYINSLEAQVKKLEKQVSLETSHLAQGDDITDLDFSSLGIHVHIDLTWNELFLIAGKASIGGRYQNRDDNIRKILFEYIMNKAGKSDIIYRNVIDEFSDLFEKVKIQFLALDLFEIQMHTHGEQNYLRQYWVLTPNGRKIFTNLSAILKKGN